MAKLALDHDERHALVCHLHCMGMAELMGREASPNAGFGGAPAQVGACGRGRP